MHEAAGFALADADPFAALDEQYSAGAAMLQLRDHLDVRVGTSLSTLPERCTAAFAVFLWVARLHPRLSLSCKTTYGKATTPGALSVDLLDEPTPDLPEGYLQLDCGNPRWPPPAAKSESHGDGTTVSAELVIRLVGQGDSVHEYRCSVPDGFVFGSVLDAQEAAAMTAIAKGELPAVVAAWVKIDVASDELLSPFPCPSRSALPSQLPAVLRDHLEELAADICHAAGGN